MIQKQAQAASAAPHPFPAAAARLCLPSYVIASLHLDIITASVMMGMRSPLLLLLLLPLLLPTLASTTPLHSLQNRLTGQHQPLTEEPKSHSTSVFLPFPIPLLVRRGGGVGLGGERIPGAAGRVSGHSPSSANFLQRLQQQAGDGLDKLDLQGLQASVQGCVNERGRRERQGRERVCVRSPRYFIGISYREIILRPLLIACWFSYFLTY